MFFSETLCNFAVELPNKHCMEPKIGDRMKLSPHIASGILLACVIALALISCGRAPEYPSLLLAADSSIMKGNYDDADSLLALYDQSVSNTHADAARFRQLLALERMFVSEKLTESDFSLADSLCRFYEEHDLKSEYSKALCVLGEIYRQNGDYPSALDAFLKAGKLAEECRDSYELCWVYQKRGDIFFDQKMYDESVDSYQEYYHIASLNRDTLRMALAAFRMGEIYTYKSDVDSTIYYYSQALDFGGHTRHPENIVPYSRNALCDIYIQIEEYDKALELLSRDSTDDANWAYWHLGQEHIDSAIWYFKRIDGRYGVYGQSETLHHLALLEESKGNTQEAMYYYKQRDAIYDSIRVLSQVEATQKVNAQYNQNLIKKERDDIAQHSFFLETVLYFLLFVVALLILSAYFAWNYHRQKRKGALVQQKLLHKTEEEILRHSSNQLEANKQKIVENEKRINEFQLHGDDEMTEKLKLDTQRLKAQNCSIEVEQRRQQYLLDRFQKSPIFIKIKVNAGKDEFRLTDEEWQELAQGIDEVYDNFTLRLISLTDLSEVELRTCYLLKIGIAPVDIAKLLCKTRGAISMLRQRLYSKITNKHGAASQLDEIIMRL